MTGDRLLWLAEWMCGARARRTVLEPLIADWQREFRDARGPSKRAWVLMSGGGAFVVALAICVNPFRGEDGRPARRFLFAVLGFALVAMIIQSAPFQAFSWQTYRLRWDVVFFSPARFATGLALAMLPAAMLASGRFGLARFAMAVGVTLALAFISREIVAPASWKVFERLRRAELVANLSPSAQQKWNARQQGIELRQWEARRRDETGAWAHISRIKRHEDGAFAVMAIAFGLAGLAIGRARTSTPSLSLATAWWFFAWMGYQLLQFWANRLRVVALTPIEAAIWLPPLAVLAVATVALRFANLRESAHRSDT